MARLIKQIILKKQLENLGGTVCIVCRNVNRIVSLVQMEWLPIVLTQQKKK